VTQPERAAPQEAFVSHSDQDRELVDRLSGELTRHGISHWLSRRELAGSQQWHDEIGAALGRCDWFILLLSPNAVDSMWVKRELLYALNQRRFLERIVPIVLADCEVDRLSWTLSSIQRVDFRPGWSQGMEALLRIWGRGYQGSRSPV
jgi:hypothetical protein